MGEIATFAWKVGIIVVAIPIGFLLVYLVGLLIASIASKYCPTCKKRKKEDKSKKELIKEYKEEEL